MAQVGWRRRTRESCGFREPQRSTAIPGQAVRIWLTVATGGRFGDRHANAEQPLLAWYREVLKEDWDTPAKVKEKYRGARIVGGNRVVFDI